MMHGVFAGAAAFDVHHVASRIERWCIHAALHTFDQSDILRLQHFIYEAERFLFSFVRLGGFKEKIELLPGLFFVNRVKTPHHEIAATGVTHQGYVGPQKPDRMIGYGRIGDIVGAVFSHPGFSHVA